MNKIQVAERAKIISQNKIILKSVCLQINFPIMLMLLCPKV